MRLEDLLQCLVPGRLLQTTCVGGVNILRKNGCCQNLYIPSSRVWRHHHLVEERCECHGEVLFDSGHQGTCAGLGLAVFTGFPTRPLQSPRIMKSKSLLWQEVQLSVHFQLPHMKL